jgi:hypothetical protein
VVAVADGELPRPATGGQLLNRSTPIAETSRRGLHLRSIEDLAEIRRLLERARENHCVFHRDLNTQVDLDTAPFNGGRIVGPGAAENATILPILDQAR